MYLIGQDTSILDDIVDHLDHSKLYDGYIVARCPFHDDQRPSFFVYPDIYRCASCDAFGKTSDLLDKLETKFRPQIETKVDFYNPWSKWLEEKDITSILKIAWKNLVSNPSTYLKSRGISYKSQIKLRLGLLNGWITIPIFNSNGKIEGAIARATPDIRTISKYVVPKQQDPNLLYVPSWKRVNNAQEIYLTFGIFDAISLLLTGRAAMSTTNGTRIDSRALDSFRRKIIIVPDHREEKAALQLASRLGWRGDVWKIDYPIGTKDPNDLLIRKML